jgi:hypothetical protein
MVIHKANSFIQQEEDKNSDEYRRFSDLNKQENCDVCQGKITDTRVIRSHSGIEQEKYLGVFCSTKCSGESRRREEKNDTKV